MQPVTVDLILEFFNSSVDDKPRTRTRRPLTLSARLRLERGTPVRNIAIYSPSYYVAPSLHQHFPRYSPLVRWNPPVVSRVGNQSSIRATREISESRLFDLIFGAAFFAALKHSLSTSSVALASTTGKKDERKKTTNTRSPSVKRS